MAQQPQILKYFLSGPWQKKFAKPCYRIRASCSRNSFYCFQVGFVGTLLSISDKSPTQIQFKQTGGRAGSCNLGTDLPASMARFKDGLLEDQSQPVIFSVINGQIPSERSWSHPSEVLPTWCVRPVGLSASGGKDGHWALEVTSGKSSLLF